MFKFNFQSEKILDNSESSENVEETECYQCHEINVPNNIKSLLENIQKSQITEVDYGSGLKLSCLSSKEALTRLKEQSGNEEFLDVVKADELHSDLLSGKYEGGLKTWECTKDLSTFLMTEIIQKSKSKLKGKKILDLGCGSGILGIVCLINEADVTFQDYNKEVLEGLTILNVFLNCNQTVDNRSKFYSGDWSSFLSVMVSKELLKSFDYILTSETIYNIKNYKKLINIFKELLRPDGVIYVAAKTHYFGVGGSIQEFQLQLEKNNFRSHLVWQTTEGVSRKILEVKPEV